MRCFLWVWNEYVSKNEPQTMDWEATCKICWDLNFGCKRTILTTCMCSSACVKTVVQASEHFFLPPPKFNCIISHHHLSFFMTVNFSPRDRETNIFTKKVATCSHIFAFQFKFVCVYACKRARERQRQMNKRWSHSHNFSCALEIRVLQLMKGREWPLFHFLMLLTV